MKKVFISIVLFLLSLHCFAQYEDTTTRLTREDYLSKSRGQKTGGKVLLVGGAAVLGITVIVMSTSGFVNFLVSNERPSYAVPLILGGVMVVGSIPLLIASGRNKRKAMNLSTSLKFEENKAFAYTALSSRFFPALSIKLNLK